MIYTFEFLSSSRSIKEGNRKVEANLSPTKHTKDGKFRQ